MSKSDVMELRLSSTSPAGLNSYEVAARREKFGWNELPKPKLTSPLVVLARQFTNFLILILIAAAVIAYFVGDPIDTLAIVLVVFLNGVLGFVQEWRAETALDALRDMLSPRAIVIRDGQEVALFARELVPDDVILLEAGDNVPADAQLTNVIQLRVDESVLTGESLPVEKNLTDQENRVFAGTAIVAGRGEAVVTAIGGATEFGKIAEMTGAVGTKKTDLQRQLGKLARQLGLAALGVAGFFIVLGLYAGRDPVEIFMTGLSLAVAMVPEGLPAVVTVTLALGAAAMVRQKALARRLQAVESLGAVSVICTDKTGTLTENKMTATQVWTPERLYDVTGVGYDPAGHIVYSEKRFRSQDDPHLSRLLQTAITCSHARLTRKGTEWTMVGEPTEGALVTLAYKGWADIPDRDNLLGEIPFSSERKRMSVLARTGNALSLFTKGAPEQVLELCTRIDTAEGTRDLREEDRAMIQDAYQGLAQNGLRVIALASRPSTADDFEEKNLTFLGLVGLIDPPRVEVRPAIAAAKAAGIRIIMITGDSPVTARAIATTIGLSFQRTITGAELEELSSKDLEYALHDDVLFARTQPVHKLRIIEALQKAGLIVAMTGDGVNDAPALKQSDIGVSMGIRGTDVAKDASDIVLLDDNFSTIIRAVGEGRRQFDNIQKFVRYLLSSNAGEVVALVINIAIGGPLIFLATQVLWMNLVTDGITAIALGLENTEPDQMQQPPKPKSAPLINGWGLIVILCFGAYTGLASLLIFFNFVAVDVTLARTAAFTGMVMFEKFSVFAFRSFRNPCWRMGWLSNPVLILALLITIAAQVAAVYWPPLQTLLRTAPLGFEHWSLIFWLALPILVVPEVVKTVVHVRHRHLAT